MIKSVLLENGDRRKLNQSVLNSKAIDCEQFADKKINAKNAFDVNVEYLEGLPNLLNKNEESSWQKASASLDASAKIYGYRVDSVHSETFKFLGGLSRTEARDDNNLDPDGDKKEKKERIGKHDGYLTLERDPRKLDLVKYDLEFDVDPLFKSMTAKFSEAGARGLLLNNLPLDKNLDILLECKETEPEEKAKKNSDCSEISTEIKSILDKTLSDFSLQDLKNLQICPDLNYFKKSRELETSLERTFYQNLMSEFDEEAKENLLNDKSINSGTLNDSFNFADNLDQDNISSYSQNLSQEPQDGPNFDENMEIGNISNQILSVRPSYVDGFSYLKSDDIKEYIHKFGDGNKDLFKNLPHFKNFADSINRFDKWNISFKSSETKKDQNKRIKKEEKLFDFRENNEIKKTEIFDKEKKATKEKTGNFKKERVIKRKVKQHFNYDQSILFNLFSIRDQIIQDDDQNLRENRNNHLEQKKENVYQDENDIGEQPDFENRDDPVYNQTFAKIDSEYEKKFGRLYKTFDVRFVKSKIWESVSNLNKKQLDDHSPIEFKDIMGNISHNLSKEIINNISTPTCFVCLLHLSNEKSNNNIFNISLDLFLEEVDQNNFIVKVDDLK